MRFEVFLVLVSVFLASCTETGRKEHYERASEWCENRGGVQRYGYSIAVGLTAYCEDGFLVQRWKSEEN